MTTNAYERFCADLLTYRDAHPSQRDGQAHFNLLYEQHPYIATVLHGTHCDPFYNDVRLPAFLAYVRECLEDQP